jgi:hypothetical protein
MVSFSFNRARVGALSGNRRGAFPSDLEEGMY